MLEIKKKMTTSDEEERRRGENEIRSRRLQRTRKEKDGLAGFGWLASGVGIGFGRSTHTESL